MNIKILKGRKFLIIFQLNHTKIYPGLHGKYRGLTQNIKWELIPIPNLLKNSSFKKGVIVKGNLCTT